MENKFEKMANMSQSEHQVKQFRQLKRLKKLAEMYKDEPLKLKSLNKQIKKREEIYEKSI